MAHQSLRRPWMRITPGKMSQGHGFVSWNNFSPLWVSFLRPTMRKPPGQEHLDCMITVCRLVSEHQAFFPWDNLEQVGSLRPTGYYNHPLLPLGVGGVQQPPVQYRQSPHPWEVSPNLLSGQPLVNTPVIFTTRAPCITMTITSRLPIRLSAVPGARILSKVMGWFHSSASLGPFLLFFPLNPFYGVSKPYINFPLSSLVIPSVALIPALFRSLGSLLEIQYLGPHPRQTKPESAS